MAGMLDNMKDKMGDMSEEMRERMSMLENKAKDGRLDDSERSELEQLRSRMSGHAGQ
jgi:hypothetical protein